MTLSELKEIIESQTDIYEVIKFCLRHINTLKSSKRKVIEIQVPYELTTPEIVVDIFETLGVYAYHICEYSVSVSLTAKDLYVHEYYR